MASFNQVTLLGNLVRDVTLKHLPSQTPVAELSIALNRKWKTQQGEEREEVTFVDLSAFGRSAEILNQYCRKGKPLMVEGRLKLDSWEDKNGGGKRSKMSVVVESFQLLGGREGGQGAPRQETQGGGSGGPGVPSEDQGPFKDSDIPFAPNLV